MQVLQRGGAGWGLGVATPERLDPAAVAAPSLQRLLLPLLVVSQVHMEQLLLL
jgi:hypothetical protein